MQTTVERHIFFDLSDLLVRGTLDIERVIGRQFNCPASIVESKMYGDSFRQLMEGKISEDAYLESLIEKVGLSGATPDKLKEILRTNFRKSIPGMKDIIQTLSAEGRDLTLVSDNAIEWAKFFEASHRVVHLFRNRYYSYEMGSMKRDPETIRKVLADRGLEPEEVIIVDDNIVNVAVFAQEGLDAICFTSASELRHDFERRGITIS